ncbi:MAG: 3-dehydroquinate synthase [Porticoccaceae bacterium]|nr:3-dehydroquinate synthase [Pseudomonadales bacterium]MCP5170993.1 3-dehydroquinate synthase [Pseudomonadales bacterium]MCP5301769.1 3-dehydroquinate synthase [Pseudomonadales bacterium]
MRILTVELGERSYPIYIGENLLSRTEVFKEHIKGNQVLVVSNETIAPLFLSTLLSQLSDYQVDTVLLPDGEQYKNLETLNNVFDALLAGKHNRSTTLIALGGGVVGDMTGFAAASYQRGVNFIQVPTTLLAQVDSSVGGKTAVNHAMGKNMIGAFYQPQAVVADTKTLETLPDREFRAGLAEVIKYGLIADADFFQWLENNIDPLLRRDTVTLSEAIERSCRNKAEVVAQDEREGGIRAILNLGHTFGHAIETAQSYKDWLHGEAVAAGMVMAADLSMRQGMINASDVARVQALIERCSLPIAAPTGMTSQKFLELMAVDKKVLDGSLRLVLLSSIGSAVITSDIDHEQLLKTLESCREV